MANKDVPNIVVMVGGTTDPGNTDSLIRSASYQKPELEKDPDWYWRDNPELLKALKQLRKKYTNLHLFTAHGWTGDNGVTNRKVAGAYLANRLCGGDGKNAYYQGLLKSEVSFHLIGHSHGGNVINELTREAATSKSWPKHWKIRSITYLSTPFFTRLHPVNVGAFDKDCRILNVFCRYDLTQRVIADFSLNPMTDLLQLVGVEQLTCKLQCLTHGLGFDRQHFEALIKSVNVEDTDKRWWGIDPTLMLDKDKGTWFYGSVLKLLGRLHEVFTWLQQLVTQLNKGIDFPVPKELDASGKIHREVMSPALAGKFRAELNKLEGGLKKMEAAFKTRLSSGQFPLGKVIEDLHVVDFLAPLVAFISVDRKTLQGPLWNLVVELLEQNHEFDNTSASPEAQLRSTPFATRIVSLDISREDSYSTKGKDVAFNKFIKRLEGIETRYAQTKASYELRDLLFTLLAHVEPMRAKAADWATLVDWYEGMLRNAAWLKKVLGTKTAADDLFLKFVQALESYALIIKERDCGQLEVPATALTPVAGAASAAAKAVAAGAGKPKQQAEASLDCGCIQKTLAMKTANPKPAEEPPPPPMGSLGYLAIVAHSTSRRALYTEVQKALEAQLNTLKR
jgi:hypothetical protein